MATFSLTIDSNAPIIHETFNVNALIGGPAETTKTIISLLNQKSTIWMHESLKVGDQYPLRCGHEGKVIWISHDEQSFAVQGKRRSCINCGKKSSGTWTPTVYTFQQQA